VKCLTHLSTCRIIKSSKAAKRKAKEMTGFEKALKALTYKSYKHNRILACLFLHYEHDFSAERIQEHGCELTIGGIKRFFTRYYNLLEEAISEFVDDIIPDFPQHSREYFYNGTNEYHAGYCAYVIGCYKNNALKFLKVGMSNDFNRRMREHLRNKTYDIDAISVYFVTYAPSRLSATTIETRFRNFYQKFFTLTRNDRFYGGRYEGQDNSVLQSLSY